MTTRITGLYSNLDVDSLVSAGVASYQNKVDKAKQQEQILEWKQEQYRSIQSDTSDFYDKYLTTTGEDSLLLASNWNTKTFTSSDESAVSATCTSDASIDDYTVSVTQLASAAETVLSKSSLTSGTTFVIGTKTYTLSGSTQSAIISNLNSQLTSNSAGITASYSSLASDGAGGLVLKSDSLGEGNTITVTDLSAGSIVSADDGTYLNATITNLSGDTYTIDDTSKITSNTQTVDDMTFTFNKTTSDSSSTYLTSSSIDSLLGDYITRIDTSNASTTGTVYYLTDGSKVTMKNDGKISAVDSDDNDISSISITNGPSITLNSSTGTATVTSTNDNAVTLTGTNDVSDLQDKIESFMDEYNTLIETINGKIYETYDSDYQPLTDAEEEDMSDTEISNWNTQAQTGLLRHDSYLEKLAADMKSAMSSFLKSSGIDIESIGISAVDDYTTENGTYDVDSDTLEKALKGNITKTDSLTGVSKTITFSDIKSLFTNGYSSITTLTTKSSNSSTDGLLSKLKVALNVNAYMSSSELAKRAGIEGTTSETTNEITQLLDDQNDLIDDLEEKLADKEDALYLKYSNLETKLSALSSSSSLFSSSSS